MQYPVYVLNLDTDTERRDRMARLLGKLGVSYEVVPAVLGKALTRQDLQQFEFHEEMDLGPGEYGCLLSHVDVWRRFLASGADCCFVLEDDLHFSESLDPQWLADLPADESWVLKLETFFHPVTIERETVASYGERGVHRLLSDHGGTGSYAISRAGARLCLARYRQMRKAIDTEMFSPHRRTVDLADLSVHQMVPAPCVQDMFLPPQQRELAVASTIGADRADLREFKARSLQMRLKTWLRNLLRPIYRKVQSLALWPMGQARIRVQFS